MLECVGRGASHGLLKLISIESVSFYFLFRSKNCNITTFEVLLLLAQWDGMTDIFAEGFHWLHPSKPQYLHLEHKLCESIPQLSDTDCNILSLCYTHINIIRGCSLQTRMSAAAWLWWIISIVVVMMMVYWNMRLIHESDIIGMYHMIITIITMNTPSVWSSEALYRHHIMTNYFNIIQHFIISFKLIFINILRAHCLQIIFFNVSNLLVTKNIFKWTHWSHMIVIVTGKCWRILLLSNWAHFMRVETVKIISDSASKLVQI